MGLTLLDTVPILHKTIFSLFLCYAKLYQRKIIWIAELKLYQMINVF